MNKVVRKKQTSYTTISNVFLRDKNLSIKAKGFLAVVMGLPEKWDFSIKGICSILKEGKTAIYNVIQELKEYHYCETNEIRDEKGLYLGLDYVFYEEPHIGNLQQEYPNTENQDTDNEPQYNKEYNSKKERINETNNKEERDKSLSKKDANAADAINEFVERMYALYPTKCPKRNISLGKSYKDKDRIKRLLNKYSMEDIEMVIRNEIETKYGISYMQNFSTFLNNFPDPTQIDDGKGSICGKESVESNKVIISGVEYR